jgi:hypothetical protein
MGEFYDLFILSISYGYQYDISHLPTAEELTKDIDFKQNSSLVELNITMQQQRE